MFKKIILLSLMSLCWQINLFSMCAYRPAESINDSDKKCKKCSSMILPNGQSKSAYLFICNNRVCKQRHLIWKNSYNSLKENSKKEYDDMQFNDLDKLNKF